MRRQRIKNEERDNFAGGGKDIYVHRKEDLHRERGTDKHTSTWAVGLSAMRAGGGVRRKSLYFQPQCC